VKHLLQTFFPCIDINFEGYFVRNILGQRGPTGANCFWAACVSGRIEIVRMLLDAATEYAEDENDTDPVKRASATESCSTSSRRLNLNVMAAYKRDQAFTGFWLACRAGHLEMVKLLLHGFEGSSTSAPAVWASKLGVNSRGETDRTMDLPIRFTTPFQAALMSGNIDLVRFLIDHGTLCGMQFLEVASESDDGGTGFQLACCYPAEHPVKDSDSYLASCIAGKMAESRPTAAEDAAHFTKQVLSLLLHKGFPTSGTPLRASQEIVQYVRRKSEVMQVTALWWACMYGNIEAVQFLHEEKLLENDPKTFLEKDIVLQRTPMWIACCNGHVDIVRFLMQHCGVDPSAEQQCNGRGCSPFAVVCAFARHDVMQELVPAVNKAMKVDGWMDALRKATCTCHEAMVMNIEDLDCASTVDRSKCLELLLKWCEKSELLEEELEHNVLPTLRNAPRVFRGRNVEYGEFGDWILMLEKWSGRSQGQKRKADDM